MRFTSLLLVLSTCLMAHTPVLLKAARVGHVLVLNDVFLNRMGPFRMAIDTGNSSSLIRPEVAQRLGAEIRTGERVLEWKSGAGGVRLSGGPIFSGASELCRRRPKVFRK